jgi:hypothetical protein
MSTAEQIVQELEVLSPDDQEKVLEFVHVLKCHPKEPNFESLYLSYSVLAKDWLTPEEDEAWKEYQ